MDIIKEVNGNEMDVQLVGRLDTVTSADLEKEVKDQLDGVEKLVYDFENLEYVSSAGLRVLLACQKIMNKQGEMIVKNVETDIMEILEITGFTSVFKFA